MKRDPDLIRELMLAMEAEDGAELLKLPIPAGHGRRVVEHHFRLLIEGGLVTAGYASPHGRSWAAVRLTWAGYDYLDRIRDPQIWRYTKAALSKTGAWSLETIGTIAKAAIVAKLEALERIDIYRSQIMAAARCMKPVKWMVRRSYRVAKRR